MDKLQSYYDLRKAIDRNSRIFDVDTFKYLEQLLNLKISALQEGKNNLYSSELLNESDVFKNLVIYNLYNNSMKLANDNYIIDSRFNRLSFGVNYNKVKFNIFLLDYNDIPSIYLYQKDSISDSLECNDPGFLVPFAREAVLERFLMKNDLVMSDFSDENIDGIKCKVKKYGYSNIYIK
jgi:hypothetical protein